MVGLELLRNWTFVFSLFHLLRGTHVSQRRDLTSNLSVHTKRENTVRRNKILADQNVFYV